MNDFIICRNCYVQFEFNDSIVFTQKSSDCELHDFKIPDYCEIYTIQSPCFFIRKKDKEPINNDECKY